MRDLPAQMVLLSFLGTFFAYYLTETVIHPGSAITLERPIIDYYIDIYLHGILGTETP